MTAQMPIAADPATRDNLCLDIRDLKVHFTPRKRFGHKQQNTVKAVDGVSLAVPDGETLAVVGESGCGKSTLGRAILRVNEPTAGEINYRPRGGDWVDLATLGNDALAQYRLDLRMIFQDPFTSLNPRQTVLDAIGQPLFAHGVNRREVRDRVADIMGKVGLRPEYMSRYPHAFSGGERQRIVIARALVVRPHVVVADEAVAALDVSVRAQTLNLLQDLQDELKLTYLFISHDLSVVRHISSHVAVMYVGRLIEYGPTETVFRQPLHPYTSALLSAIPISSPDLRGKVLRQPLSGEVADPANPPPGCHFHPRCPFATEVCRTQTPATTPVPGGGTVACHHWAELSLKGMPS
ncbi:MAG: peptide transporter ATP-binding protein [Devosia sp.]|uniref:ABC transporter ATP-binding protein n=1 Tax=Devosia sp. TaxID=1871048 RepID=UPI00261E3498|nr:oligopeptide/dipeptide ABC transporter ATP-binding protein [Devosia sp.]MDB5530704.1 peptide transporter ATP-binding protein [Devosia sp.]